MKLNAELQCLEKLLNKDSAAYFEERRRLLDQYINATSGDRTSLLELQSMIDMIRATSGTPIVAAKALASLLEAYIEALGVHDQQLHQLLVDAQSLHDAMSQSKSL